MMHHSGNNHHASGGGGRNHGGGFGRGGYCICAACGHKLPHEQGVKCTGIKCPNCGKTMVRQELLESKKQKRQQSEE